MSKITFGIVATNSPEIPRRPVVKDRMISELHKASIIGIDYILNKIDSLEYYQEHWQSMVIQDIGCCECSACLSEREKYFIQADYEIAYQSMLARQWAEHDEWYEEYSQNQNYEH